MSDFQNSSSLDSKDAKENSKEESKEDESLWEQEQLPDIGTGDSEHGEESEPEISRTTSENDKKKHVNKNRDSKMVKFCVL